MEKTAILEIFLERIEKYTPAILAGAIGAIIMRIRKYMSFRQFIGSVVISVFVALSTSIICRDFLMIKQESIINVLCSIFGIFSKLILDELEEILQFTSEITKEFAKKKLGISKKDEEDDTDYKMDQK